MKLVELLKTMNNEEIILVVDAIDENEVLHQGKVKDVKAIKARKVLKIEHYSDGGTFLGIKIKVER